MTVELTYKPVFYTDGSEFDYFNKFFTNFVFYPKAVNIIIYSLLITTLICLNLLMYHWFFGQEIALQYAINTNDLTPTSTQEYELSTLYSYIESLKTSAFECSVTGELSVNGGSSASFHIGSECMKFL